MQAIEVRIDDICNLSRIPVRIDKNPIKITADLLISDGVNSLSGFKHLKEFYDHLAYTSLNSLFETDIKKLDDYPYFNLFLPWVHCKPVSKFEDNAFITSISDRLILDKVEKIKELLLSIKKQGFVPQKYSDRKMGQISGYFLRMNDVEKFYVVSGNHRVACLSALGFETIPAILENKLFFKPRDLENFGWDDMPVLFDENNISFWPSVTSGFLKEEEAAEICNSYLKVQ